VLSSVGSSHCADTGFGVIDLSRQKVAEDV
jgi:hypothetical protein